jgi:transposase-like protein
MLSCVPDKTACPRCGKVGLVRFENVIRAGLSERHYYCGSCNHSWAVSESGNAKENHGHLPERSRAAE